MIDFLVRRFVKDYENVTDANVRGRYGVFSAFVGIACNIVICSAKFIIGFLANSIAIISDGFNNLSDCASCIVTMFGYKMAAKPADKDHPFGHGRMEYLTSLVIAAVIMLVGGELLKTSIDKIIHPTRVTFSVFALVVLILSIAIKLWMGHFNRTLGKRIDSGIMLATAKDSFNDVLATLATVLALVASIWTDIPLDGIMGIVVSLIILVAGYGIIKETVDQLLGQPADEGLVQRLKEMVQNSSVSLGMHDLIIHSYGPGNLIGSVHIEVDSKGDILTIHDAIDEMERRIYDELKIRMTIHMDPIETDNEILNSYREKICDLIKKEEPKLSVHDFRMVSGPTHTNLIFDVLIPYDVKVDEAAVLKMVEEELEKETHTMYAVITFDHSYC
ncbi:MAG: cation diffusion facilitator family transporter [Eubacteriales bacterium]|nr:cation diffusion facilitator family transporter [Lachnospiraceae bacterium]MDO5126267.1 cation diffusion facilitator family transporter [Eubacteriales bacterium]